MGSCVLLDVKSGALGGGLSQAVALERQPMRVMHQPVQDGVGDGGIGDHLVPVLDGQLAGHDGTAATMSIVDDLQEVAPLIRRRPGVARSIELLIDPETLPILR